MGVWEWTWSLFELAARSTYMCNVRADPLDDWLAAQVIEVAPARRMMKVCTHACTRSQGRAYTTRTAHNTTRTHRTPNSRRNTSTRTHKRTHGQVHYTDWSSKFDEWLPVQSYRLAPLHTHSPPPQPQPATATATAATTPSRRVTQASAAGAASAESVDVRTRGGALAAVRAAAAGSGSGATSVAARREKAAKLLASMNSEVRFREVLQVMLLYLDFV